EAGAVDYLLKPVSQSRLRKSVERAANLSNRPSDVADDLERIVKAGDPSFFGPSASPASRGRKIVGRSGGGFVLLDPDEVLAFQAQAELVWIVTSKQRLLADQPLRVIEQRFEGTEFQRVHRNAIVNINHVKKMTLLTSQRWMITLSNSLQIVVSK